MWPLAFVDSADTQYVTLHGDPDQVHVPAEEGEMYVSLSGLLHTDLTFYASATVSYSIFLTGWSSSYDNLWHEYFLRLKIANFVKLIVTKHVDGASWKFVGKELRICSST